MASHKLRLVLPCIVDRTCDRKDVSAQQNYDRKWLLLNCRMWYWEIASMGNLRSLPPILCQRHREYVNYLTFIKLFATMKFTIRQISFGRRRSEDLTWSLCLINSGKIFEEPIAKPALSRFFLFRITKLPRTGLADRGSAKKGLEGTTFYAF
jgi:hypothetical protein